MAIPSECGGNEAVYVNVKQYHGILRRRAQRAKAEMQNKLVKQRKVRTIFLLENLLGLA